ncbi:MAG: DAK2 domain-containing protein, partial [Spirochaetia bacterium]|nr:DAK2 domain-containing protein [Spirochaetia bacterium]
MNISGKDLYASLTFGYSNLRENMLKINIINVFPVADGDTGSNITHTLKSILSHTDGTGTVKDISNNFARAALLGARGNSGMIIAQFFQGFFLIAKEFDELTIKALIDAAKAAVASAYKAVENPMEGTMLTVMRSWANQLSLAEGSNVPIPIQLRRALRAARKAEKETTNQMELLKRYQVVDAGAKDASPLPDLARRIAEALGAGPHLDFNVFMDACEADAHRHGVKLTAKRKKLLQSELCDTREEAAPVLKKMYKPGKAAPDPLHGLFEATMHGKICVVEYEPDTGLRDSQQVGLLE